MTEFEQEPLMRFRVGDEQYDATPDNASIFMHCAGELAIGGVEYESERFDHLFMHFDEQVGRTAIGIYLFRERFDGQFNQMAQTMYQNDYTCHFNLQNVAEIDIKSYFNMLEKQADRETKEIGEFMPDDWD